MPATEIPKGAIEAAQDQLGLPAHNVEAALKAAAPFMQNTEGAKMDLEQARREIVAELSKGQTNIAEWDKWYSGLPADLRHKLSLHDFKRLGDCFKSAFGIKD